LLDLHIGVLVAALIALIFLSAFFSAVEIGMMTLNRYRLRHLAESGHRGARITANLLKRPDRLLGIILLGNNAANIAASSVATLLALELYGERAISIAAGLLVLVVLIFAEVAPKTLAALHPERVAFPASYVVLPLLRVSYPIVWLVNVIANRLLRLVGVSVQGRRAETVSTEELKTVVMEAGALMPEAHQDMLLAILDLEKVTVADVMVPRGKIEGINLDAEWDDILAQLTGSQHTRIPVFRGNLDRIVGIVHLRRVLNLIRENRLERQALEQILTEPYFVPDATPLNKQLLNFKDVGRRVGLVVDEYGDIQGLITMDDILEEIVGDFTSKRLGRIDDVHVQPDGSYLVRGTVSLRDLNRKLGWELPTDESRTLNGLIVEYLEDIPEPGTSLKLGNYLVEILRTRGTAVEIARVRAAPAESPQENEPQK
jgi:Mg2+/Co2+ transporter CorB